MMAYIVKELLRLLHKSTKSCIPIQPYVIIYWELTIVLEGSLTYVINGTEYKVESNDAILVPSGSHRKRYEGSAADYISFNFIPEDDSIPLRNILYKNVMSHELKSIISVFPRKSLLCEPICFDVDSERKKAANILNYIILDIFDTVSYVDKTENVKKAISYINDNLFSPISLDDVSRHISISKEYLSTLFKNETGKTVTEYINERKMIYAKETMLTQKMSLSQLAQSLGYASYSYFSRVFKRYYSISPSKYLSHIKKSPSSTL